MIMAGYEYEGKIASKIVYFTGYGKEQVGTQDVGFSLGNYSRPPRLELN